MQKQSNYHAKSNISSLFDGSPSLRVLKALALLFLVLVVLFAGYLAYLNLSNKIPRSLAERNLYAAQAELEKNQDVLAEAQLLIALIDAGKLDEALEFNESLGNKNVDFAPLAYAQSQLYGALAKTQKDEVSVVEAEKKSAELLEKTAESLDEKAGSFSAAVFRDYSLQLEEAGDYRKAFDYALKVSKLGAASAEDYVRLGALAESIGDYFEAAKAYLLALSIDPKHEQASKRASELKSGQAERYEAAVQAVKELLDDRKHGF